MNIGRDDENATRYEMTSIDEQIAFIDRRIHAGTDAEFYRGIRATLTSIRDAQPVSVEPDVCEFSPSFDPDYSGPTEWVPKYQFDSMQSALKLAQEERDNEKEVRNCISRAHEAEQKRAENAESLAEQNRKDAERYRWLRDSGNFVPSMCGNGWGLGMSSHAATADQLDAAIDSARAE